MQKFLDKYDTILFDMDGVVTHEQVYWNAATLAVYELLHSKFYYGSEDIDPQALMANLPTLRAEIFDNDALITLMKNKGLNNNWDLAWVVTSGALSLKTTDFSLIFPWAKALPEVAEGMYANITESLMKNAGLAECAAGHQGELWQQIQLSFQEWFLGNELAQKLWNAPGNQPGKTGLCFSEEPLVNKEKLLTMLSCLAETKRLGIGTGRPRIEAETPLKAWNAYQYLEPDTIVTYDELAELQKQNPGTSYAKPHPYMFLRGVFGTLHSDEDLLRGNFDNAPCQKTLVVGDAACDLFAAKNAGCDFAAVLTGVQGESAREFFEENGADYILRDVLEFMI